MSYTYDPAGQLIASQHGDRAHRYPVDAAGNRLSAQPGEPARPNAANQLSELDGSRYRFDGAGNLIEREQQNGERLTLGYDGANRLVHLTHTSAYGHTRHAHYRYDALGRRISKSVRHANGTTATTHYGWDGDRLVHEAQDNRRTTVVYEPGTFVPMLRIDETANGQATTRQIGVYHTDALGTPMQLVTPKGETLWQAQPDDWAAVTNEQGRTAQPIRFQGQWHDEESGLYYNRHRYYDPQQGRYISQDPIGLKGGTNLYGYVTNPTGMVDPLGLFSPQTRTVMIAAHKAEKVRSDAWCAAQFIAMSRSVSQLPPIMEQQIKMGEEERASRIQGCESDRENRRAFLMPDDVVEGEYNACIDRVDRNYNERVIEVAEENVLRYREVDKELEKIFVRCMEPSPGDLDIPKNRR